MTTIAMRLIARGERTLVASPTDNDDDAVFLHLADVSVAPAADGQIAVTMPAAMASRLGLAGRCCMTRPEPDLFDSYPERPGWRGRESSADAAEAMTAGAPRLRATVLAEIVRAGSAGLTADQTAVNLGLTPFSCRPRCTELAKQGLIEDSGRRRANLSGRKAIVWVAVPAGRLAATAAAAERASRIARTPTEADHAVRRIMREET